ncbi:hypothetical protein N8150_02365 [Gammaproteobacteria bacterium]|nr:hypothetical protein [Gammaproteobacteria bacterium]
MIHKKLYLFMLLILSSQLVKATDIKTTTFAFWDKPDIELLYVLPKEINSETKVLFIIHGASRDAEGYLKLWIEPSKDKNVILVAPSFTKKQFRYYSTLGISSSSGKPRDKSEWLTDSIGSFFTYFKSKYNLQYDKYLIYGYSGGSQFVHRYLMYGKDWSIEKAAIGSAGWYTFLNNKPFPYGLKDMTISPGRIEWLMSRKVLFILSDEDNDRNHSSLNTTPGSMQQGDNRFVRGTRYFSSLINIGEKFKTPFRWQLKIVKGVAHDKDEISIEAMPFMLSGLEYKN